MRAVANYYVTVFSQTFNALMCSINTARDYLGFMMHILFSKLHSLPKFNVITKIVG